MAKIKELTKDWEKWLKGRSEKIREMVKRFPPDRLYRLNTSGHRVEIYSYCEDGTFTVPVLGKWNAVMFERNVFGIKESDLEECDLPATTEPLGVALTEKETDKFLELKRKELANEK